MNRQKVAEKHNKRLKYRAIKRERLNHLPLASLQNAIRTPSII